MRCQNVPKSSGFIVDNDVNFPSVKNRESCLKSIIKAKTEQKIMF